MRKVTLSVSKRSSKRLAYRLREKVEKYRFMGIKSNIIKAV